MRANTRVVLGDNYFKNVFEIANSSSMNAPMVIIDSHVAQLIDDTPLERFKTRYLFDSTASEPRTEDVDDFCENFEQGGYDSIIAIGGGSIMDLGKAMAISYTNGRNSAALQGWGLVKKKAIPCITVPTISGTGAELSMTAVLKGPTKKLGINSEFTAPTLTIVDPTLTATVETSQGVPTFMDCYVHCVEIVLGHSSPSDAKMLAKIVIEQCEAQLLSGYNPSDPRWAMVASVCSYLGGVSLSDGSVGACHAISYGLSQALGIRHGVANLMCFKYLYSVYGDYIKTVQDYCDLVGYEIPRITSDEANRAGAFESYLSTSLSMEKLWKNVFPQDTWRSDAERLSTDVWSKMSA